MGQYHLNEQRISFYKELVACEPPADFAVDGTPIEFISVDLGGVKEELIVDPTAEARYTAVGNRARRKGRRNGTFNVVTKIHGNGVVTADAATVTETYLGTLLEHCYGGLHLGTSHVIDGGTATVPILDSVTGVIPGCMLAFEDISSPEAAYDGFPVCRRVLAVDAGTKAVTLSEALPWTPAADDPVHACQTVYLDRAVLKDAKGAGGTMCWYVALGEDVSLQWRMDGCVATAKIGGLGMGGLPQLELECMNANFANGAEDDLVAIDDLGEPEGHAQLSMSLDVTLSIQAVGNTAINEVDANAVNFEPGIARSKSDTVTGRTYRFHGLATYSVTANQTKFTCTINDYNEDFYAALAVDQAYRITLTQPGNGNGAGAGWCIHMGKARLVSTPGRADVGDNHGLTLEFEASEPADTTGGSNVDLQKSRFLIALF